MSEETNDVSIKAILLGEAGVGKTNLIRRAMGLNFEINTDSNLTSSYCQNEIIVDNIKYPYQLWDTAGQEKFRSLNQIFIKNSKVIMIVFAINSKKSFDQIDFCLNYAKETLGNDGYIFGLVANKSDLYEQQEIEDEEIKEKANKLKIKFIMTSAATDESGFKNFLDELLTDFIKKYYSKDIPQETSFTINKRKHIKKKKTFLEKLKSCFT